MPRPHANADVLRGLVAGDRIEFRWRRDEDPTWEPLRLASTTALVELLTPPVDTARRQFDYRVAPQEVEPCAA